jgi:hypothetical protein
MRDDLKASGKRFLRRKTFCMWMADASRLIARWAFAEMQEGWGAVMMWKRERDLLIAQTMAFVQSVAGKPLDAGGALEARLPLMSPDRPSSAEHPIDALPARLSAISQSDLRDDIRRRVAAFRARQQAFDRDRDQYCNAMMAKARASIEQATKDRDYQPPKG